MSFRLTDGPDDEDWPATTRAPDGSIWMAYIAYKHAGKLDAAVIHGQRKFDDLVVNVRSQNLDRPRGSNVAEPFGDPVQ